MQKHRYSDFRNFINSFGYLTCMSKLTLNPKTWFWRMIGHTARTFVDDRTDCIYVYESTTLNKGKSGVQLTLMSDWIKDKKDVNVYYRPFAFHDSISICSKQALFLSHIKRNRGKPYPELSQRKWRWYLINAALDIGYKKLMNKDQDEYFFCTQLSADLDKVCGIIPDNEIAAEWEPDDCRPGGRLDRVLCKGCTVGYEVELYE